MPTNVMFRSRLRHRTFPHAVAEGLTLFGGEPATDATVVSPLHADGTHTTDGQALAARKHKERTYLELCHGNGRARLVVIAGEVRGRWSQETKDFLWCLARAKAACVPRRVSGSPRAAWYRRWSCFLACTAKSVATSLLGVRGSLGVGNQVLSVNEVLAEVRRELWCGLRRCAGSCGGFCVHPFSKQKMCRNIAHTVPMLHFIT